MLLAAMARDEVQRTIHYEGNGTAAEQLLNELVATKRATQLRVGEKRFWVCAERLPMLQTIYPQAVFDPQIIAPETAQKQSWERSNAIRELLRGRMEVSGPMTAPTSKVFSVCRDRKSTPVCLAWKVKVLFSAGNFIRTQQNRNGATDDCSHEFID
jgi:hypothetical protein